MKVLSTVILLFILSLNAQESYEIEDIFYVDKLASSQDESMQTSYVIDKEELNEFKDLDSALSSLSSIYVASSGGESSLRFRGMGQEHILILLNGVRINDPSSVTDTTNLKDIDLESIERVEIIKGAAAVMYGSNSIGAVINLVPKKITKNSLKVTTGFKDRLSSSFFKMKNNYFVQLSSYFEKDNSLSRKEGSERDLIKSRGLNLQSTYSFNQSDLDIIISHNNRQTQDDSFSGDAEGPYSKSENLTSQLKWSSDRWEIKYAYYKMNRSNVRIAPTVDFFKANSSQVALEFKPLKSLLFGSAYQKDSSLNEQKNIQVISAYTISKFKLSSRFSSELGLRLEDYSELNSVLLYSFASKYVFRKNQTLRFIHKTGFRRPSLFQLYSSFGDSNLKSEKGQSTELSYILKKKVELELSLFKNKINNLIAYDFTNMNYINQKQKSQGFEVLLRKEFERIDLEAGFTSISYKGESILRRPRLRYNLKSSLKIKRNTTATLRYSYIGSREDFSEILAAYNLVDLNLTHSRKNTEFGVHLSNILNEQYEDISGFNTLGFNYLVSAKYLF